MHRRVLALLTLGLVVLVLGCVVVFQANSFADDQADDLFSTIELEAAARLSTVPMPDPLLTHSLPRRLSAPSSPSAGSVR